MSDRASLLESEFWRHEGELRRLEAAGHKTVEHLLKIAAMSIPTEALVLAGFPAFAKDLDMLSVLMLAGLGFAGLFLAAEYRVVAVLDSIGEAGEFRVRELHRVAKALSDLVGEWNVGDYRTEFHVRSLRLLLLAKMVLFGFVIVGAVLVAARPLHAGEHVDVGYVVRALIAVGSALVTLVGLRLLVAAVVNWLRRKGDVYDEAAADARRIGLSSQFGWIESFLFFIAAAAGKDVFGVASAGWLVFKGIHQWGRWRSADDRATAGGSSVEDPEIVKRASAAGLPVHRYLEALSRNRFMIFAIGTGMSVTAGGLAGTIYHRVLDLLG